MDRFNSIASKMGIFSSSENKELGEEIIRQVLYILALRIARNGHSTPENLRTKMHMQHISDYFGVPVEDLSKCASDLELFEELFRTMNGEIK